MLPPPLFKIYRLCTDQNAQRHLVIKIIVYFTGIKNALNILNDLRTKTTGTFLRFSIHICSLFTHNKIDFLNFWRLAIFDDSLFINVLGSTQPNWTLSWTGLNQSECCPGQGFIKVNVALDSTQTELCPRQHLIKLNIVPWTALNKTQRCPRQHLNQSEQCPGQH